MFGIAGPEDGVLTIQPPKGGEGHHIQTKESVGKEGSQPTAVEKLFHFDRKTSQKYKSGRC